MSELRKDPIIGRWVILSTERGKRPSDFTSSSNAKRGMGFCPFCPGNEHTAPNEIMRFQSGQSGDWTLRVVPNRFPALNVEGELERRSEGMFGKMNGIGAHEVIIETGDHQHTLATMSRKSAEDVFWAFYSRITDLKKDKRFKYVHLFKNEGNAAGASLEHSHSQLIALPIVPKRVQEEIDSARKYYDFMESCIFCDLIEQELFFKSRVIIENSNFIAISPFAPRVPFETWILPKSHESAFQPIDKDFSQLADIVQNVLRKLDIILNIPPYNLFFHISPFTEEQNIYYHWHIEIIPRLTRRAGFEWGSGFYINPTTPEDAAKFLIEV